MQELEISIPDHVFTEFKDYWLDQPDKKLRSNWDSILKNRLIELVVRGTLRPQSVAGAQPYRAPQHKCRWSNTVCEDYAESGSKYCAKHREVIRKAKSADCPTIM